MSRLIRYLAYLVQPAMLIVAIFDANSAFAQQDAEGLLLEYIKYIDSFEKERFAVRIRGESFDRGGPEKDLRGVIQYQLGQLSAGGDDVLMRFWGNYILEPTLVPVPGSDAKPYDGPSVCYIRYVKNREGKTVNALQDCFSWDCSDDSRKLFFPQGTKSPTIMPKGCFAIYSLMPIFESLRKPLRSKEVIEDLLELRLLSQKMDGETLFTRWDFKEMAEFRLIFSKKCSWMPSKIEIFHKDKQKLEPLWEGSFEWKQNGDRLMHFETRCIDHLPSGRKIDTQLLYDWVHGKDLSDAAIERFRSVGYDVSQETFDRKIRWGVEFNKLFEKHESSHK